MKLQSSYYATVYCKVATDVNKPLQMLKTLFIKHSTHCFTAEDTWKNSAEFRANLDQWKTHGIIINV